MSKPGSGHVRRVTICLAVLLSFLNLLPPGAGAYGPPSGLDSNCSVCHTLDAAEGDANTSYINSSARTFPLIKAYDGLASNQTPEYLGCTFCHYLNEANTVMKPVLNHFQGKLSFHPVGVNFTTDTTTNRLYVSSYGSNSPNELDCVDCHDIDLRGGYPQHNDPLPSNPYMLRGVTVAGEYDGLCRTCHRSDAAVTVKTVSMQLTKHADGAAGRPLVEDDGTVLKTNDPTATAWRTRSPTSAGPATTRTIRRSTSSSTTATKKHKVGAAEVADTAIVGDQCTTVCHYPGDANNSFVTNGHGAAASTYKYKNGVPDATGAIWTGITGCTTCHVVARHRLQAARRANPERGDDRDEVQKRYNLNMPAGVRRRLGLRQPGQAASASSATPATTSTRAAGRAIGCQDCHDEHAEGRRASNNFMIPETIEGRGDVHRPPAARTQDQGRDRAGRPMTRRAS